MSADIAPVIYIDTGGYLCNPVGHKDLETVGSRLQPAQCGLTPLPGCRDEGLLAQKAQGVRGAVRTDGIADHSSEGDVVVRRSGI